MDTIPYQNVRNRASSGHTYQNFTIAGNARVQLGDIHQSEPTADRILAWLPSSNTEIHHVDAYEHYHEGTLDWLFAHPKFTAWKSEQSTKLLCHGEIGTGKTILTAAVIEHLQEFTALRSDMSVCFFYCQYNQARYQTLHKIFGTFLRQILHGHNERVSIPDNIKKAFSQNFERQPSEKHLRQWLRAAVGTKSRVYVILDGIDELGEFSRERLIDDLTLENVSLFATTRNLREMAEILTSPSIISVSACKSIIPNYVLARLRSGSCRRVTSLIKDKPSSDLRWTSLEMEIVERIDSISNGMFLLASLLVDLVQKCRTVPHIRACLETFPETLEDYLDEAWSRITEPDKSPHEGCIRAVFDWVLGASIPLEWEELQRGLYLLSSDSFPNTAQQLESSMMRIDDILVLSDGLLADPAKCADGSLLDYHATVEFIHASVRQYFERQREQFWKQTDMLTSLQELGFFVHVKGVRAYTIKRSSPHDYDRRWVRKGTIADVLPKLGTKLLIATCASMYTAVESLLVDIETRFSPEDLALHIDPLALHCALNSWSGFCDPRMIVLLMAHAASKKVNHWDKNNDTPLHHAARGITHQNFRDKMLAIRYLVENGANPCLRNKKDRVALPGWKIEQNGSPPHSAVLSFPYPPATPSCRLDDVDREECGIWTVESRIYMHLRYFATNTEIIKEGAVIKQGPAVVQSVLPMVKSVWRNQFADKRAAKTALLIE